MPYGYDCNNVFANSILGNYMRGFRDPLADRDPQFEKPCSI